MKLKWDIKELTNFGNKITNPDRLAVYLSKATQDIAKKLHKMLITETPVDYGNLQAAWKTKDNYSYVCIGKGNVYEVVLLNRSIYATWVNDGHKQRPGRFIPGYWEGTHFRYDPSASGGMVLKKAWVQGRFFVERSVLKTENSSDIEIIINRQLQKWFKECVNG